LFYMLPYCASMQISTDVLYSFYVEGILLGLTLIARKKPRMGTLHRFLFLAKIANYEPR
jgi:hypothetical protein